MAAPVGDPDHVRIINGHEVVFGKRSKSDAKSWPCEGCRATNHPRRMLIFDIPRFRCHGCGRPFQGDFDICLANVKVNTIPLMGDLKCQDPDEDECIAYALSYMVEMIYKIDCALNSDDLSVEELDKLKSIFMDTASLSDPYNERFHASPIQYPGIHKLLHLCQKLKQQGVRFQVHGKKRDEENSVGFQVGEIQIVHSFDFEEVCEQIADGNPLIATLTTGSEYRDLKFCEFYTGVTTLEFDTALARNRDVASHVVLLIGAASIGGNKGFYGLDAQGHVFCPQFAPDESWTVASRLAEGTVPCVAESSTVPSVAESSTAPALKKQKREPVCAGFGKINAETEFRMNFIKFARHGEEGSYVEDLKLLNEDESSTDVLEHNMNLMYDGEYFDTRSRIVGTKLREMGLLPED